MILQKNRTTIILLALIVLMGAEIAYLTHQNRQLRALVDDPSRLFEKTLQSGQTVPAIRAADVGGNEISLTYAEGGPYTLLLWFSPTCSSCEDNFAFWKETYRFRVPEKLRIIGFCACNVGEGRDVVAAQTLEYPVLAVTEPSIVEMYKGNLLPQTILIAPEGLIKGVWPGALLDKQKREITSILSALNAINSRGGE
jgi:peroxiredoxin